MKLFLKGLAAAILGGVLDTTLQTVQGGNLDSATLKRSATVGAIVGTALYLKQSEPFGKAKE